jgi:hypothetical protein
VGVVFSVGAEGIVNVCPLTVTVRGAGVVPTGGAAVPLGPVVTPDPVPVPTVVDSCGGSVKSNMPPPTVGESMPLAGDGADTDRLDVGAVTGDGAEMGRTPVLPPEPPAALPDGLEGDPAADPVPPHP